MKANLFCTTFLVALYLSVTGIAGADSEFLLHGRVSFDTGALMVQGKQDNDWTAAVVNTLVMPGDCLWVDQEGLAEIEMAGANFLRLADGSKAEFVSLPPNTYIRGWVGSFYIHRLARSQGAFVVTAPSATVDIAQDSMVRLDIEASGALTVSVRWGRALVRADQGGDATATEGMRVWVDPGYLPSDPVPFDRGQSDAFDDWNNERARLLAEGASTTPKEVVVQNTTVGVYDLPRYGEWVYVDSRPYWRPTVVTNYIPYRYGYWNYMPAVGHVWVDEYPFAYVTTHYGRWRHTTRYGWIWSYDPIWSPAWVASVRVADYYVWAPVDYYHRPVIVAGATTFALGGVSFCWVSTSYTSASYLYAGPLYVRPPARTWVDTVIVAQPRNVHIWNVSIDARRRAAPPFRPQSFAGYRDYSPSRSIRGIPGEMGRSFAPAERARRLEANIGRNTFAAGRPEVRNAVRTAAVRNDRSAAPRSVRLGQTEQTYISRSDATPTSIPRTASLIPESQRLGRSVSPRSSEGTPRQIERGTGQATRDAGAASGIRTDRGIQTRSVERPASPRTDVAVRDLESAAPAPPGSGQIQRTPVRTDRGTGGIPRDSSAPGSVQTSPGTSMQQRSITEPGVRSTPSTTPMQRTAPGSGIRTAPSPALPQRSAPPPSVRSTPNITAPQQRSAPAPSVRTAPSPALPQRSAPAPSVRSTPSFTAPQQRSAPAPSVRSTPSFSAPQQRSAPAPRVRSTPSFSAPQQRSAPAPSVRSTPSFSAPQQRSAPAPSVRSTPSFSAPQQRSAPAPSFRSAPGASPRAGSAPSGSRGSVRAR